MQFSVIKEKFIFINIQLWHSENKNYLWLIKIIFLIKEIVKSTIKLALEGKSTQMSFSKLHLQV